MTVTYASGYVRAVGDGQLWHAAQTAAEASVCGIAPPATWGWPRWSYEAPAALHMCRQCLERDPRRTTGRRQATR